MKLRLGIASGDRLAPHRSEDKLPHWGGAGWVRLGQYIPLLDFDVVLGTLIWNRTHFSISDDDNKLQDVDIVIIQRLMHDNLATHIKQARLKGQIVLNDLDDWYWGLSTTNRAFVASHPKLNPGENINHYKSVLNASDAIMVSTPYLQNRVSSMLANCPPIELIYNTVDVHRFTVHEHTDDPQPIVGWVGSTAHRSGDLETLRGVLTPLQKQSLIRFQQSGYHPNAPSLASIWGITETDVITYPPAEPPFYPNIINMDIGIAPLNDTPFNHAKSDIKLLEYSASGIPWVASDLSSYSALQKLWGIGRIAKKNKPMNWQKHIHDLRDYKVRTEEGLALREAVWSRDILVGAKILNEYLHSFF